MRKIIIYGLSLLVCVAIIAGGVKAFNDVEPVYNIENYYEAQKEESLGGEIYNRLISFDAGIAVKGTTIIDSDGNWEGAVTGSSATLSSTLAVTGATTLSSDLSVSGTTALATTTLRESAVTLATTTNLTVAQSGTTFYIDMATGDTINLPVATSSAGVIYKFVIADNFATSNVVIDSAEGDNIEGQLLVASSTIDCNAVDQIDFVNDGENLGDYVELRSNGSKWFIGSSHALTAGKLTCTDPS